MVFMDGSNIFRTAKAIRPNLLVDYAKLLKELVGSRNLIRAYFYSGIKVPPQEKQIKFHHRLKYQGITVVTKPLRQRTTTCPNCKQAHVGFVEKGVDVALVTDMLGMAFKNAYDSAILVSADKDYEGAIEEVKRLGKRIEIAAFEHAISEDMKMLADRPFISLTQILDRIEVK